jgi:RNA polymerase sigma-70 factor (ECF subfamily)
MKELPTDISSLSDESLLCFATDHPQVFELLVDRYHGLFYRIAHNVLHSKEDAEDTVQEAFVKIYRAAHQLRKDKDSSFKKWASAIVFRTALTKWRKLKKTWGTQEYLDTYAYDSDQGSFTGNLDTKIMVKEAVAALPPDLREMIELHYLKDLSYEDISSRKGLTIGTIKMRLFRARNVLKNYL